MQKKSLTIDKETNKPDSLSIEQIDELINNRVDRIEDEFREGFKFIRNCDKTVTVFGSARTPEGSVDYEKARSLTRKIVRETNYGVLTGGGPGIMEAANRGAFEAGGKSLGLNIKLPHEQHENPYLTDSMDFNYFFSRKVMLAYAAEAYIYFPGGFGTMDECFEILTLIQEKKMPKTPIIFVGQEYWQNLDSFIKQNLRATLKISPEDTNLYTITNDEEKIVEIIKNAPVRRYA